MDSNHADFPNKISRRALEDMVGQPHTPEQSLWTAVVALALKEAKAGDRGATHWLTSEDDHYKLSRDLVCEFAGLSGDALREACVDMGIGMYLGIGRRPRL